MGIAAGSTGFALSGGGAELTNVILSPTSALIEGSVLGTSVQPVGNVDVDASSTSQIEAAVWRRRGIGGLRWTTGVGVALGVAVARNFIGWDPSGADTLSTTTPTRGARVINGKTVSIA